MYCSSMLHSKLYVSVNLHLQIFVCCQWHCNISDFNMVIPVLHLLDTLDSTLFLDVASSLLHQTMAGSWQQLR